MASLESEGGPSGAASSAVAGPEVVAAAAEAEIHIAPTFIPQVFVGFQYGTHIEGVPIKVGEYFDEHRQCARCLAKNREVIRTGSCEGLELRSCMLILGLGFAKVGTSHVVLGPIK